MTLCGCSTMAYLGHTAKGQWQLMRGREPIDELIVDDSTPPELKKQLQQVQAIRNFAASELKLPDNKSYRSLSVTGREAVTWTVSAAPPLALEPVEWCFPIAGCVPYRGYFSHAKAQEFARKQQNAGMDVAVVPVLAYSTLGWFDDPVTDTMLGYDELALANLIFHELAHQQVYVAGDSTFNESYANWVGQTGVRLWASNSGAGSMMALQRWRAKLDARRALNEKLAAAQLSLRQLYSSDQPDHQKLRIKNEILEKLEHQLITENLLPPGLVNSTEFTALNNAYLTLFNTYTDDLCAFDAVWRRSGADFAEFHRQVKKLAELQPVERTAALARACQR